MGLARFLAELFDHGRVSVDPAAVASDEDAAAAEVVLAQAEAVYRLEFPGVAPPFSQIAASWAAVRFHRACQLVVFRDLDTGALDVEAPAGLTAVLPASRHNSVDLVFRFLPDLLRLASAAAVNDPLCQRLRRWAAEWPLSSVGIAGIEPLSPAVDELCADPGLLRLYADRVIASGDPSRLAEPRVRTAVRAALGHFPELAPALAAAVNATPPVEPPDHARRPQARGPAAIP